MAILSASGSAKKAFQRPFAEGIQLLNAIQDVYLSPEVTVGGF
jgi:class I fructose-bisphosphate aldolase